MKRATARTAAALLGLMLIPSAAMAADAAVCHSEVQTYTQTGAIGVTQNYPQLSNATRFSCRSAVLQTITQLAQAGWKVSVPVPHVLSMTSNANGSVTTSQRWQIIIDR